MQIPACAGHHIATSQGPETPHQNADGEHLQMSGLNPSCQWDVGESIGIGFVLVAGLFKCLGSSP